MPFDFLAEPFKIISCSQAPSIAAREREHRKTFRDINLHPIVQFERDEDISLNRFLLVNLSRFPIRRVEDDAYIFSHFSAHAHTRDILHRILLQLKLAICQGISMKTTLWAASLIRIRSSFNAPY